MTAKHSNTTRRRVIRDLMLGTLALWVDWRPSKELSASIMDEAEHEDKTIRAFIDTVIPGCDTKHPNLTMVFRDPFYGFGKVRWLFNFNLRKRALSQYGTIAFHKLSEPERKAIIHSGLNAENKISQLYSAAVFASQLTVFTGIYMDVPTSELIDFKEGFAGNEVSYSNSQNYFQNASSLTGNYR